MDASGRRWLRMCRTISCWSGGRLAIACGRMSDQSNIMIGFMETGFDVRRGVKAVIAVITAMTKASSPNHSSRLAPATVLRRQLSHILGSTHGFWRSFDTIAASADIRSAVYTDIATVTFRNPVFRHRFVFLAERREHFP